MEILGKIKLIGEVKTFGDNGFRKRELGCNNRRAVSSTYSY
jgi:hypothetical protein